MYVVYSLGIAALFIVFASFVFGTGVINIVDSKITILKYVERIVKNIFA